MGIKREWLEEWFLRALNSGLAQQSRAVGETAPGLSGEQARSDAHPDHADAATQHASFVLLS